MSLRPMTAACSSSECCDTTEWSGQQGDHAPHGLLRSIVVWTSIRRSPVQCTPRRWSHYTRPGPCNETNGRCGASAYRVRSRSMSPLFLLTSSFDPPMSRIRTEPQDSARSLFLVRVRAYADDAGRCRSGAVMDSRLPTRVRRLSTRVPAAAIHACWKNTAVPFGFRHSGMAMRDGGKRPGATGEVTTAMARSCRHSEGAGELHSLQRKA